MAQPWAFRGWRTAKKTTIRPPTKVNQVGKIERKNEDERIFGSRKRQKAGLTF